MIAALRKRFVLIAMLSLVATLLFLMVFINTFHYQSTMRRMDSLIALLHEHGENIPVPESRPAPTDFRLQITAETPFETRFLVAHVDEAGDVLSVDAEHIASVNDEMIESYVAQILARGASQGDIDQYRYGVFDHEDGKIVIILDTFSQRQSLNVVLFITLLVSGACIAIVFILLVVLSKRAIQPFVENMEKQRRFITDASHELKTPLAIISANTDVTELTGGASEWTQSTKKQLRRLNRLTQSLVELAKMEEGNAEEVNRVFSLSDCLEDTLTSFVPLAQARDLAFTWDLQPDVRIWGAQDSISRLLSLLLDNAVKYTRDEGSIYVGLSTTGRFAEILLRNSVDTTEGIDFTHLFDRFFRSDGSRNQDSGGYGIGLSVAQAIVLYHKGRITAQPFSPSQIQFRVILPTAG